MRVAGLGYRTESRTRGRCWWLAAIPESFITHAECNDFAAVAADVPRMIDKADRITIKGSSVCPCEPQAHGTINEASIDLCCVVSGAISTVRSKYAERDSHTGIPPSKCDRTNHGSISFNDEWLRRGHLPRVADSGMSAIGAKAVIGS